MNKSELIAISAEKAGIPKKDAERLLNAAFETVSQALARGEKVTVINFGIFEVRERSERTVRDPKIRKSVRIPATKVPSFRPSQSLKDKVGS